MVCFLFKSIIFIKKTYFALTLVQQQNSDQEKKLFLKFPFFKGTPKTLNDPPIQLIQKPFVNSLKFKAAKKVESLHMWTEARIQNFKEVS